MNKTSNQLETVFQEVTDYFANTNRIVVCPNEGSPPDNYTITYQIQGICKESNTDVYSCDTHVVSISLPFGFPHFPPNCLPESPTFHPDFDSSAICIGDIWEKDKSIVQLILHIGKMIAGEIYSKSNAFNDEAAEWYNTHSDELPFDSSDFSDMPPALAPIEEKLNLESADTLDDDDSDSSFSLEQDVSSPPPIDTDRLRIVAKQKRFQALSRELQTIEGSFEGRAELEEQIQTAMYKAMAMYHEADALEHQGEQQQALDKYNAIENIVSDYPMLQEAKDRVQQAIDLLGDWVSSRAGEPLSSVAGRGDTVSLKSDTATEKSGTRTFFEDTKAVSKKWLGFAIGGGSIALIATLIISYLSLVSSMEKATKGYEECKSLLDANNFRGAERKCDEALSLTAEVRIVKQKEKEELSSKIQKILSSKKLRQGLQGNTLHNGKYVSKSAKENLLSFKESKENGDSFFKVARWEEAVNSYTRALGIAKNTDNINDTQLAEIRKRLPRAQFNSLMQTGEKALEISDWNGATEYFGKAFKLAKENPNVSAKEIKQLERLSNQVKFNTIRDLGHQSFKAGEWKVALGNYQQALDLVANMERPDSEAISSLHENIARTKIYMAIEKGKKSFAASQWDDVIAHYEKAILLLKENSKLLSQINTEESRTKLSRIMLHAEIIKHKQDVAKHLQAGKFEAVIETLQRIEKRISTSQFSQQAEFQSILEECGLQIKDAKQQLRLFSQTSYLKDNFKKLFLRHYPAASSSALSSPKVEFLKNIGDKLLFRMQCTETAGGRPLRLQMDYLYSPSNNHWSFYSEE